MIDTIPCEICQQSILFSEYIEHVENCYIQQRMNVLQISSFSNTSNMDGSEQNIEVQYNEVQYNDILITIGNSFIQMISDEHQQSLYSQSNFEQLMENLSIYVSSNNEYEFNLELQSIIGNEPTGVYCLSNCYNILHQVTNDDTGNDDIICSICLETLTEKSESEFVRTTCQHIYCKECIDKWLSFNLKCPVCAFDFNEYSI